MGNNKLFMPRPFFALLVGLVALFPLPAHAEPSPADRATARTLAQEGYTALRNGDYAMATDRFSRAVSLVHAPSLLVDLARAQLGMGKLVDAYENYNRIIREGVSPGAPASWAKALADAKAEVAAIPPRLPWVTITVVGPSEPVVTIDETPIGAASLGVKRPADPGQHKIRASGAGFLPATKTIFLKEGQSLSVAIELEEAPPELEPEADPVAAPAAESTSSSEQAAGWRKPATITAFAVGGAGLMLGGVAGVLAISKRSKLAEDCTNAVCGPPQKADLDNYRTLGTLSTVGFITAGVGGAIGAVLLMTTPKQELEGSAHWSPFLGLGSAGVKGTF